MSFRLCSRITLYARDRLGIVGVNGSGKTTLLDIMSGSSDSDTGEVHLQKGSARREMAGAGNRGRSGERECVGRSGVE